MSSTHQPTLNAILELLTQHKTDLNAEIENYPPPIPACDTQFNYLMERRSKVYQELSQLKTLMNLSPADELDENSIVHFINSSDFIDESWLEEHQLLA